MATFYQSFLNSTKKENFETFNPKNFLHYVLYELAIQKCVFSEEEIKIIENDVTGQVDI